MSNPKHTPGPWSVDSTKRIYGRSMRAVADVVNYSMLTTDKIEDAANAQLISACPEMLEALRAAHKELARAQKYADVDVNVITKVAHAIMKATGEKYEG